MSKVRTFDVSPESSPWVEQQISYFEDPEEAKKFAEDKGVEAYIFHTCPVQIGSCPDEKYWACVQYNKNK